MAQFSKAIRQMDTWDLAGVVLGLISAMLMTAGVPSVFGYEFTDSFAAGPLAITIPIVGIVVGLAIIVATNQMGPRDLLDYQTPEALAGIGVLVVVLVFAYEPQFVVDYFTGTDPNGPLQAVVSLGVAALLGVVSAYPYRK